MQIQGIPAKPFRYCNRSQFTSSESGTLLAGWTICKRGSIISNKPPMGYMNLPSLELGADRLPSAKTHRVWIADGLCRQAQNRFFATPTLSGGTPSLCPTLTETRIRPTSTDCAEDILLAREAHLSRHHRRPLRPRNHARQASARPTSATTRSWNASISAAASSNDTERLETAVRPLRPDDRQPNHPAKQTARRGQTRL